jgi:carbonic anhydrase
MRAGHFALQTVGRPGGARLQIKLTAFAMSVAAVLPMILIAQDEENYKSPWRTPWTYEQAAHWSELDPLYDLCNTGKAQSPIDIRNAQKESLPDLRFEFKNAPLKYLTNNGHTIRVNYRDAPGTGSLLMVGNQRYQLAQFHFHHPSEEYVDGKPHEMEIHLMYQAASGEVAGIAVFIKRGHSNQTVEKIWQHMPKVEGQIAVTGVEINPADLVPHNLGYYRYTGSQTAPPCTEPVTWFVLKTPIEASPSQIDAFAGIYPHDVRPIQPLNGRIVSESQ